LWIGPVSHPEIRDAFKFCSQNAAQLAVRRSTSEAVRRPAGFVQRIIFARPTRHVPKPAIIRRLTETYPNAKSIAICSQLCDGEGRTGTAWPIGDRLRFSRWAERLPQWLSPCTGGANLVRKSRDTKPTHNLLIVADRFETAEPLMLWADSIGVCAAWHRRFVPALHDRYGTILWDDSVATATDAEMWAKRLSQTTQSGQAKTHIWMSLQPSIDEMDHALRGGISHVVTKPVMIMSLSQPFAESFESVVRKSTDR
jgi:hypothetical protein